MSRSSRSRATVSAMSSATDRRCQGSPSHLVRHVAVGIEKSASRRLRAHVYRVGIGSSCRAQPRARCTGHEYDRRGRRRLNATGEIIAHDSIRDRSRAGDHELLLVERSDDRSRRCVDRRLHLRLMHDAQTSAPPARPRDLLARRCGSDDAGRSRSSAYRRSASRMKNAPMRSSIERETMRCGETRATASR